MLHELGEDKDPLEVTKIGESAFSDYTNRSQIEISNDSKLQIIEGEEFDFTSIQSIKISSEVRRIDSGAISSCKNLQKIRISNYLKLKIFMINHNVFSNASTFSFVFPSKKLMLFIKECIYIKIEGDNI